MKLPKNYHVYHLSQNVLGNIITRRGKAVCYTCENPIEKGQKVLSKSGGGRGRKTTFRHYDCAKKVGLI